jgi:uncharacterized membrane protein/glutaredoxin
MNKNRLILIVAILGMLFTGYMTYVHYQPSSSVCLLGGNQCTQIIQGSYSELLGIPVSLIGFLVFFSIAFLAFMSKESNKNIFWLSLLGVFGAGYFNYIMIFKLGSLCPWCELSHFSYLAILFLSSSDVKKFLSYAIIILFAGVLVSSIANESGDYEDFAKCLTAKNVTMYSAFWCPNCKAQKDLFGKSFQYINHVECSLPNRYQTPFCDKQGIEAYPTWEIKGKKKEGLLQLEELSEKSGCELK